MYTLIRSLSLKSLLLEQLPALLCALLVAESFYKFHSFLLEGICFLVTWFVFDALIQFVRKQVTTSASRRSDNP
ncbi:hypothetical protein [Spirosoma aerophilum]